MDGKGKASFFRVRVRSGALRVIAQAAARITALQQQTGRGPARGAPAAGSRANRAQRSRVPRRVGREGGPMLGHRIADYDQGDWALAEVAQRLGRKTWHENACMSQVVAALASYYPW